MCLCVRVLCVWYAHLSYTVYFLCLTWFCESNNQMDQCSLFIDEVQVFSSTNERSIMGHDQLKLFLNFLPHFTYLS
uniref:Uncharacterized protein n=1 Tax=Nelumbo nucifera TaxID=4432 RepID=A0A822YU81_NELNU|nr:TPA_asm: hypothetical protein HUJ06_006710 [Nelumbo nucifera]